MNKILKYLSEHHILTIIILVACIISLIKILFLFHPFLLFPNIDFSLNFLATVLYLFTLYLLYITLRAFIAISIVYGIYGGGEIKKEEPKQ